MKRNENLNQLKTEYENLTKKLYELTNEELKTVIGGVKVDTKVPEEQIQDLIGATGTGKAAFILSDEMPRPLSGEEKQRISIAQGQIIGLAETLLGEKRR